MTFRYIMKGVFANLLCNFLFLFVFYSYSTLRTNLPVFGTEWERKVLLATSNDREIPDSDDLLNIADATLDPAHYREIMDKLWERLNQKPKDWKIAFKVFYYFLNI